MREGYKKTEIGVIPVEWEVVELGDILTIQRGASPRPINEFITENEDGVNWIKIGDIKKNDKYIVKTKQKITDDGAKKSRAIKPKDFVLSNSMSFGRPYISRIYGCIHDGWLLLRNKNENNLSNNYLYEILSGDLAKRQFKRFSAGSTVNNLKSETVSTLKIPLPPLKEQKEIANILSTADKKIEAIDLQIKKAQTLKKGLLQKLLSEGVEHSEFKDSELGRIPVGWEVVKVGNISNLTAGGTPRTSEKSYWYPQEVSWLSSGEVHKKKIFYTDNKISIKGLDNSSAKLLPCNSILIALAGQGKTRGTVAITEIELTTNQSVGAILPNDKIIPYYLYYNLDSRYDELRSLSTGSGGRGGLNLSILKSINIQLPPLKEQKQIAQILSTADEKLELLRAKKEKYETLKKGLLQKLLSGEVRVGCCP